VLHDGAIGNRGCGSHLGPWRSRSSVSEHIFLAAPFSVIGQLT
jgi:hypothetical protein